MDAKLQNLSWACLPKEARDEIKMIFNMPSKYGYPDSIRRCLLDIYGDNLTSDTEPEEMLYQKRAFIMAHYSRAYQLKCNEDEKWAFAGQEIEEVLYNLFGDKCLPDAPNTPNSGELIEDTGFGGMSLTPPSYKLEVKPDKQPSVQGEPKFRKDDKVRVTSDDKYGVISRIVKVDKEDDGFFYTLDGVKDWRFFEKNLEPYTEPETKDNMEEKELNLCELLKGCEGEKFFSLMFGDITFVKVIEKPNLGFGEKPIATSEGRYLPNAMYGLDGVPTLFPSRALYEKYPLNAYSAWMEWKEAKEKEKKKKNWWRAENGDEYWLIDSSGELCTSQENFSIQDDNYYEFGNYFRTESEAKEMVVKIKELLLNGR